MNNRGVVVGGLLLLALLIGSNFLYVVKETERAVLLKFGEVVRADIEPGLHFKVPLMHTVRRFDGRILTVDSMPERFLTLEKKAMIVDSYAKWRVIDTLKFYTATNGEESRANALLSQRITTGLRNKFGERTMHEVVSGQRDELMHELTVQLDALAREEFGIEVVDIRVKRIDLPPEVSSSVFRRMNTEREREAREHRSKGNELAEGIRAAADRERTIIEAEAFREAEILRGEGDARAAEIYAAAFGKNAEFYAFTRSLQAYRDAFQDRGDIMLLNPDSEFFRYMSKPGAR